MIKIFNLKNIVYLFVFLLHLILPIYIFSVILEFNPHFYSLSVLLVTLKISFVLGVLTLLLLAVCYAIKQVLKLLTMNLTIFKIFVYLLIIKLYYFYNGKPISYISYVFEFINYIYRIYYKWIVLKGVYIEFLIVVVILVFVVSLLFFLRFGNRISCRSQNFILFCFHFLYACLVLIFLSEYLLGYKYEFFSGIFNSCWLYMDQNGGWWIESFSLFLAFLVVLALTCHYIRILSKVSWISNLVIIIFYLTIFFISFCLVINYILQYNFLWHIILLVYITVKSYYSYVLWYIISKLVYTILFLLKFFFLNVIFILEIILIIWFLVQKDYKFFIFVRGETKIIKSKTDLIILKDLLKSISYLLYLLFGCLIFFYIHKKFFGYYSLYSLLVLFLFILIPCGKEFYSYCFRHKNTTSWLKRKFLEWVNFYVFSKVEDPEVEELIGGAYSGSCYLTFVWFVSDIWMNIPIPFIILKTGDFTIDGFKKSLNDILEILNSGTSFDDYILPALEKLHEFLCQDAKVIFWYIVDKNDAVRFILIFYIIIFLILWFMLNFFTIYTMYMEVSNSLVFDEEKLKKFQYYRTCGNLSGYNKLLRDSVSIRNKILKVNIKCGESNLFDSSNPNFIFNCKVLALFRQIIFWSKFIILINSIFIIMGWFVPFFLFVLYPFIRSFYPIIIDIVMKK